MKLLKQIKSKALSIPIFDKKPQKQEQKTVTQQPEGKPEQQKEGGVKSIAKSIFSMFKQQAKSVQQGKMEAEGKNEKREIIFNDKGRIWMTAPPVQVQLEIKVKQQPQCKQKEIETKELEINEDSAAEFVANLQKSLAQSQREVKMRVNKAKNQIFGSLQIQPIYLSDNILQKILTMQLSGHPDNASLVQRTQTLVLQSNSVDRAIESALVSGYLWEAHGMKNRNIIDVCYRTVEGSSSNVRYLHQEVMDVRGNFSLFVQYFSKISGLNRRRVALARKIQLLKSIKQYKKDICQQFTNIDQAFYIQRSRQKHYHKIKNNPTMCSKVILLQSLLSKLHKQNHKIISLIQSLLSRWVDGGQKMQTKHVEKLLILLYFTRNQKMYTENGLRVDLGKLRKKDVLVGELNQVKKWKDYRYVNDKAVKMRVGEFLNQLILWLLGKDQAKSRKQSKDNNKETGIQNILLEQYKKIKQKTDQTIKF